ncbi:hypothetical protein [Reichenbachiella versicolor]|uniref:hypothetical protein n=1 Tax=Reichenbachiella versicolor TaxID=1821036 RepID=UPI000D6DF67A|nr:hypothetical protein [Reichenbachiella versicolor]
MKHLFKSLLFAFIASLTFTIVSCDDDEDGGWSSEEQEAAIKECVEDGDTQAVCECAIPKIADKIDYSKWQDDDYEPTEEETAVVLAAYFACLED